MLMGLWQMLLKVSNQDLQGEYGRYLQRICSEPTENCKNVPLKPITEKTMSNKLLNKCQKQCDKL